VKFDPVKNPPPKIPDLAAVEKVIAGYQKKADEAIRSALTTHPSLVGVSPFLVPAAANARNKSRDDSEPMFVVPAASAMLKAAEAAAKADDDAAWAPVSCSGSSSSSSSSSSSGKSAAAVSGKLTVPRASAPAASAPPTASFLPPSHSPPTPSAPPADAPPAYDDGKGVKKSAAVVADVDDALKKSGILDCPVLLEPMTRPMVVVPCGHTMDLSVLQQLQKDGRPCPMCSGPIQQIIPNFILMNFKS